MTFSTQQDFARQLDAEDPLRHFRDRFHLPRDGEGEPVIYFAGNSLGLMPKSAAALVQQELEDWRRLGVDAHLDAATPWYSYHETLREPMARLVGAKPLEVVCMNSLTVNLHLMLATFYRPTKSRFRILMEEPAFPSDTYAVTSQIRHRGLSAEEALVLIRPQSGEFTIRLEDLEEALERGGEEIAVILIGAVNFFTGQSFDIERITRVAHQHGICIGVDLAHAVGNIPLALHDWNVDWAVWCSYKYLNGGPGAVAGAFVHERHATNIELPRLAGWFGNNPHTRFRLHLEPEFVPVPTAERAPLSATGSFTPLRSSLDANAGCSPLQRSSPITVPSEVTSATSNVNSSWVVMTSPSMRSTSVMATTRRVPSESRSM